MDGKLYEVDLAPGILARGFWLYVWKIVGPNCEAFCYVGMTGDVTGVAQSPFARASAHFGFNKNSNAIRRHLESINVIPEKCQSFRFLVYGPVLPYEHRADGNPRYPDFDASRKRVAALEKRLWQEAKKSDHKMLNREPQSASPADETLWDCVRAAFARDLGFLN